jgi:phosphoglycolate phosphatase
MGRRHGGAGVNVRTVLFDLDGTLTDPRRGFVNCVRHALEGMDLACPPDDVLASFIGPPLRGTLAALVGGDDAELVERATARFRERYAVTGIYENHPYDGVHAMLEALRRRGLAMLIATSKPRVFAQRIVERWELHAYCAGVYGPELDGRWDAKTELLAHLVAAERIDPASAVMVGDRAVDAVAARASGMRAVGVLWGYGTEAELTAAGADALCAAPTDLPACLTRLDA